MKIRVFYYVVQNIDDPNMNDRKKQVLNKMNRFNEYIEYEKFDKEYKKAQAALIYLKKRGVLQQKRKVTSIFCKFCNKNVQKNAYNNHLGTQFHKSNEEIFKGNTEAYNEYIASRSVLVQNFDDLGVGYDSDQKNNEDIEDNKNHEDDNNEDLSRKSLINLFENNEQIENDEQSVD
jgi:hypothetical protein